MKRAWAGLGWIYGALAVALVLTMSTVALGQSAADKATARKLATEGIKLYQQGQFDDALDRLKRAQALYDAPVHLLYMARAQVKLGQLVEGAESYRRLVRTELDAKAPDVFKAAVADGEKELSEVEPRIPGLTIKVDPSSAEGLTIQLDGEPVSVAVLGVERPVNPGTRTVTAEAPGYLQAQASTTLREGERQELSLTLEVDPDAPVPSAEPASTTSAALGPDSGPKPESRDEAWRTEEIPLSAVGFFVGIRGGALFPSGGLQEDVSTTDFMSTGGGAELHGGVRFLRNFGVKLFFERYALLPGPELDAAPQGLSNDAQFEITSTAHASSFGFSAIAGTPRGRIGGYGELGLALVHEYGWDRDIVDTAAGEAPEFSPCSETRAFRGPAFRIGGAFVFPVHPNVQLSAVALATLGTFSTEKVTSNCRFDGAPPLGEVERDISNGELHQQFFLGIGGDFVFGEG